MALFPFLLWILLVMIIHRFIPENNVRYPVAAARAEKLALSFLALHSSYRLFSAHDGPYANRFLDRVSPEKFRQRLAFALRAPEFWLAALPPLVLVPALVDRFPLTAFLWADERVPWAVVLLLTEVYLFAGILLSHLRVQNYWLADNGEHPIRSALKDLLLIFILYPLGALLSPAIVSAFASVGRILVVAPVFSVLFIVIALVWLVLVIRALLKRRKFFRSLRAVCEKSGYRISGLRGGFRAVILPFGDATFTLEVGEKTYRCRMICCLRRGIPLILSPDGRAMFLHIFRFRGMELFRYTTVRCLGDPNDGKTLLIAVPVAGFVYSGTGEAPVNTGSVPPKTSGIGRVQRVIQTYSVHRSAYSGIRPIDTGVSVGNFKFFTSTGFLGALERDVLDR